MQYLRRSGCIVWLLVLILWGNGQAQHPRPLEVSLSHATFRFSETTSLVELYFGFGVRALHFEADSAGFVASLPMQLSLQKASATTLLNAPPGNIWKDETTLKFRLADTSGIQAGQYFVHIVRLSVPPGEYVMRAVFYPGTERQQEIEQDIRVPDYADPSAVRFSHIELASSIAPARGRKDQFYKNGLTIRPNPNVLYGPGLSTLYYYTEVYHLLAAFEGKKNYTLLSFITSSGNAQPVDSLEKRVKREVRSPDVLIGSFDVRHLPTGAYELHLAILNEENEAIAEQTRKFFVYNPDLQPVQAGAGTPDVDVESSLFLTMTEEELDTALEHAKIIASSRELKQIKKLKDVEAKREFLITFWKKRDPDPRTPVNEYRQEFYSRLQYANERYSSRYREGWKTDRGRVIIKYGPPSAIEPHLYDRDTIPYEIWQYNNIPGEGQAIFIFADRNGFGEFELIHSTVSGERKSVDWQAEVRRLR